MFLSVKNYYPNYLNYRGPRVFSCTNPWLNEADARWERERERERFLFPVCVRCVFTEYFHESGMKRDKGKERRRDRERAKEIDLKYACTLTTWLPRDACDAPLLPFISFLHFAFSFFLCFFFFFFFCSVNAFGRCIIREIVACEKWSILPYLVKTCQREITNFGIWF